MDYSMDIMIDIETLGNKPWSVIASIGAVAFDYHTFTVSENTFLANVTRSSCEEVGLAVDQKTLDWWSKKDPQAWADLQSNQFPLPEALTSLKDWFFRVGGKNIWANGAAFDLPILETAYNFCGMRYPWHFMDVRDFRTAYNVLGYDWHAQPKDGTHHNALDDCRTQVRCLGEALGK